jgi:conjugative transfer region protein (TIGR03750 family)
MLEESDLLAHRLNFDAVVFCSCTMKEMQVIAVVCLTLSIITLGCLTKLLINMFLVGVGVAFPLTVVESWAVALIVQRLKQGKPKGYVKQTLLLWCEDHGLMPSIYLRRSGKWSIERRA